MSSRLSHPAGSLPCASSNELKVVAGRWAAAPVAKLFAEAFPTTCGLPGASIEPLADPAAEWSPTWDAEPAPGYPAAIELCDEATEGLADCAAAPPAVLGGASILGERLIMRRPWTTRLSFDFLRSLVIMAGGAVRQFCDEVGRNWLAYHLHRSQSLQSLQCGC